MAGTHKKQIPRKVIVLDQYSPQQIEKLKQFGERYLKFHWDYYCDLAYQRSLKANEIERSLIDADIGKFKFRKWQRILKFKYSNKPLSVAGSLKDPGGRFNIGDINPTHFNIFPALYITEDKETALQELLCQKIEYEKENEALEMALTDPTSTTNCSVSGVLHSVIDIRHPQQLQKFVNLIKDCTVSDEILERARSMKEPVELIKTVPKLIETLLMFNWRVWPMLFDVPAPSQIFGQLVNNAGIQAILYPSKFNNKDCLAIFPQNFDETDSYIELDDVSPPETKIKRLDSTNWKKHKDELMER